MLKTIHLFRHGQTDWNAIRRIQGHTDIPLNSEGQNQALSLQSYFQENSVDLFMTSDLVRAHETARIANSLLAKPLHVSPAFREVNLGELEGLTLQEAHDRFGMESWQKWVSVDPVHSDFCFPKAESARKSIERFTQALKDFCMRHEFNSAGLCTHGLVMRRFLHSLRPELQELLPIPNCVVYKVEWDSEKDLFYFNS